jgi:putative PIN family toxin of toxin-antitoxin system
MRKRKTLRLVIDTNLWISFLISKSFQKLDEILLNSSVKICFSYELLSELHESTSKPKLAKHFGDNAIEEMLFALSQYIELVEVTSEVSVCRDPNDNFILALCKDADADFLLTGDKDLLASNPFGKTKILSIAAFISIEK